MTQDTALEILKTGANVFLTGEPGSGKTHTVSAYVRYLRQHNIEPSITASTGIAATHVGGMTIHAWSGIGIKRYLTDYDLDALASREPLVRRVATTKVLIIDEISMLDGVVLGLVDKVLRSIRRSEEPFGGIQMVFVGDFFQLPPIPERQAGLEQRMMPQFAFTSPAWKAANPLVAYLTEQHRQDDETFLSALSMIRSGELDESLGEIFEERRVGGELEVPNNIPLLYTHNIDVDKKNEEELAKLEGDLAEFHMTSRGKDTLVEQMKRGCLSPELLRLKEGASVMFTKNDFEQGYVNGTLGVIDHFDEDDGLPVVQTRSGNMIKAAPEEWSVTDGDKVLAKLSQIPLRLAWAITVHKSQGMSLDAAVMDLSRAFEYGQGYVALSRVRTLSGLYLAGMNRRAFEVHPIVLERDREMRTRSDEADEYFQHLPEKDLTLMHENFITASGGTLTATVIPDVVDQFNEEKKKKGDTYLKTKELILERRTLVEIATMRGVKTGTIISHIEILKDGDDTIDFSYMKGEIDGEKLRTIHKAFQTFEGSDNEGKLTPVKDLLGPVATFDEIRFARLFIE